jgi:regulator of replication initiation timing
LAGSHENAPISQGEIINQKNIEIDSLRKDLAFEKNENATKAMEIDRLRRELIELKVIVT